MVIYLIKPLRVTCVESMPDVLLRHTEISRTIVRVESVSGPVFVWTIPRQKVRASTCFGLLDLPSLRD